MRITRRECALVLAAPAVTPAQSARPWTKEWDNALIQAAARHLDAAYNPAEKMISRKLGPEYRYHSNLRSTIAHPTRDSLEYALILLSTRAGDRFERAVQVLDRVLPLQDTSTDSKWYGIWGWYMEEPPPKMSPADWNWADFNGATLLLILHFHGPRLGERMVARIKEAIHHAALSIRRRNVSMNYTNIAVKGTFVTLVAADRLADRDLRQYADERLTRLAQAIDQTGSFAEYNSPTYAAVTIGNLTRLRMLERDEGVLARAARIEERVWLHLARRWHHATKQFAGPMSRAYSTDLGFPLWIEKSLGGRLGLITSAEDFGRYTPSGEVGLLDYRCPEALAGQFLAPREPAQTREIFVTGADGVLPVQGTTWIEPALSIGSANRSEFWVQRRPLLAYWGGPKRPARYAHVRFVKDDYDFSSALFYSVQERNCVLACVNFRSPGGDRHVSLDPVQDGRFECSRLRLRVDLAGADFESPAAFSEEHNDLAVKLGPVSLYLRVLHAQPLEFAQESGTVTISAGLLRIDSPRSVAWSDLPHPFLTLAMSIAATKDEPARFAAAMRGSLTETLDAAAKTVRAEWKSPAGVLALTAGAEVMSIDGHNRRFRHWIAGRDVLLVRISEARLA
jgi:hypothetical protein